MRANQLPRLTALMLLVLLSGCYPLSRNKEGLRPPDVLAKSSGQAIVLFSTSTQSEGGMFGSIGIAFARIEDNGKMKPLSGGSVYMIDRPEQPDLPENYTNFRWRALAPGTYIIMLASNLGTCFSEFPEFHFILAPGQRAYLGNFTADNGLLALTDHLDRDVAYFRSHVTGGDDTVFSLLPMAAKTMHNKDCGPG